MEVDEPDFPTPEPIIAAAQVHIATGRLFYTSAPGLPELRSALAGFYATRYGLSVSASRIAEPPALRALCGWHWLALPNPAANGCSLTWVTPATVTSCIPSRDCHSAFRCTPENNF